MESQEVIDTFSSFRHFEELNKICFLTVAPAVDILDNQENSQKFNKSEIGRDLLLSFQKSALNPINALSMILNSKLPSVHSNFKAK